MNERSEAPWGGQPGSEIPVPTGPHEYVGTGSPGSTPRSYPPPVPPAPVEVTVMAERPVTRDRVGRKLALPLGWVLVALLLVSTGTLTTFFVRTTDRLHRADDALTRTRTELAAANDHLDELDGRFASASASLKQTESDLKESRSAANELERDLKTAELCLRGLAEIGNASSQLEAFHIVLRVGDECRSAYRSVQDDLPG